MQETALLKFKERLVFRRNALNLSQERLAEQSGVSKRSISDYETGNGWPTLNQLSKLATALDISEVWLLGGPHEAEQSKLTPALRERPPGYLVDDLLAELDQMRERIDSATRLARKMQSSSARRSRHPVEEAFVDELEEKAEHELEKGRVPPPSGTRRKRQRDAS